MNKQEILEKIANVKKEDIEYEVFVQQLPPEEFGDAVKLYFNDDETFKAVVFDPNTNEVFAEEILKDSGRVYTFISEALEPKKEFDSAKIDYIDLDRTEPNGSLGK